MLPFSEESIDLFNKLIDYDKKETKLKIKTKDGQIYRCKLHSPAEGEEDLAYHIETIEESSHFYIIECNFIETIEEIKKDEEKVVNEPVAKTV